MKLFYTKSEVNELKKQLKEMKDGRDSYREILEEISNIIIPAISQYIIDRAKEIMHQLNKK